jgi:hypothetical protein
VLAHISIALKAAKFRDTAIVSATMRQPASVGMMAAPWPGRDEQHIRQLTRKFI